MKTKHIALLLVVAAVFVGCTTVAPTQFYRPASYAGAPYRISGKLEPMKGWAGRVHITINDRTVIKKDLPMFSNSTEVTGTYDGRAVTVVLTRVSTFVSSYLRAEVLIDNERAATLSF